VKEGHVTRGWIGVEPQDLGPELAQTFNLAPQTQGVIVTGVLHGSPAQAAGLQPGDLITHVGGQEVRNTSDLLTQIAALKPGLAVDLGLQRQGQAVRLKITPDQRPGKKGG
jgi:S1-C subfamily serine protease